MITIKLIEKPSQIEEKINKALAEEINLRLFKAQANIITAAKNLTSEWISLQPEMISLASNDQFSLAGQLGIYAGSGLSITSIIRTAISNSISIKFKKFSNKLIGGFELNFQPSDFINLLSLPQAVVNYKDGVLPWLDWLLKRGDTIIVANYAYNASTGLGRSGLGNMKPGGSFRIPPQYSGVESNNFITRALIGSKQEEAITKLFKKALGA